MKTLEASRTLATTMVAIGTQVSRQTVAMISDMDQPLGFAIGNALEVQEAIATLRGNGPADLVELCLSLGAQMLTLAGTAPSGAERTELQHALESGKALSKFRELVKAQGGDSRVVDRPSLLPAAPLRVAVPALAEGIVGAIDGEAVGLAAMGLGAGRAKKDDVIDPGVGIVLRRKVADRVGRGEALGEVHATDAPRAEEAVRQVQAAYHIGHAPPGPRPLIHEVVR